MALAAPKPSFVGRVMGTIRTGCVLGVLIGATGVNVSLAMAIHTLSFNRKKAQGRSMYTIAMIYSWALRLLWWIKIRTKIHLTPLQLDQFILSSNHVSFLDVFIICDTIYKSMTKQQIQTIRLIYWEALSKVPLMRWIFYLCGGIPIKILGGRTLASENAYDKESVKKVYAEVEKGIIQDKVSIALSFEGRRNAAPPVLSKIQRGMFKISSMYNLPIVLIRLKNVHNIWSAEGWPVGTGIIEAEVIPKGYKFETLEAYEAGLRSIYEKGDDDPPLK